MSGTGALVRDVSFAAFFPALLWDSWSHPETRTQATTWGLILHTAFWGSSSETLRRMLHGPSFFYAHGVLAGWLQLTYTNPQLDLEDKQKLWGCSKKLAVARTLLVHVATVAAHHALLRAGGRKTRPGAGWLDVIVKDIGPMVVLMQVYLRLYPDVVGTYGVKGWTNAQLEKMTTVLVALTTLAVLPTWKRAVT